MIINVKVQGKDYQVEIEDLNARPVLATIEGQTFEVYPDEQFVAAAPAPAPVAAPAPAPQPVQPVIEKPAPAPVAAAPAAPAAGNGRSGDAITAPIPGVIVAVLVKEGASVSQGQELCTLEAMKMKNAIRASHAGKISSIKVAVGDHVRHGQVLMEFGE